MPFVISARVSILVLFDDIESPWERTIATSSRRLRQLIVPDSGGNAREPKRTSLVCETMIAVMDFPSHPGASSHSSCGS